MTVAQLLKHDFKSKGSLFLYDDNGNEIYCEYSSGYWVKQEFDDNGNYIYFENSDRYWYKKDYDSNNNQIYYETSDGFWSKCEFDVNGNRIYYENSNGYWFKKEYDSNGNRIYFEDSDGTIIDNRPKSSCNGNELRIGNWVRWNYEESSEGNVYPVEYGYELDDIKNNLNIVKPIPLSEEWLIKFGFEWSIYHQAIHKDGFDFDLTWTKEGYVMYTFKKMVEICRNIEYVHQLQNLYFALTGEELTIKTIDQWEIMK